MSSLRQPGCSLVQRKQHIVKQFLETVKKNQEIMGLFAIDKR
jgi:hypothetical protein